MHRIPKKSANKDITSYAVHKTVSWASVESEFNPTSHKTILSETYQPTRQRMNTSETLATVNATQTGIDTDYISKKNRNLGSKRENNNNLKDLVVIEIPTR